MFSQTVMHNSDNHFLINRLPELSVYFDKPIFQNISFHNDDKQKIMLQDGYTKNLVIKFWRVLTISTQLETNKTNSDISDLLMEVFTNQCLGCTDILASWLNYFLDLNLKGPSVSFHNKKFITKLETNIADKNLSEQIKELHNWICDKLYPYRNILHHKGELSSCIDFHTNEICYPNENDWDFKEIKNQLNDYPSHTSWLIATNNFNGPTVQNPQQGDGHKYISVSEFKDNWVNKVYNLICLSVESVNEKCITQV